MCHESNRLNYHLLPDKHDPQVLEKMRHPSCYPIPFNQFVQNIISHLCVCGTLARDHTRLDQVPGISPKQEPLRMACARFFHMPDARPIIQPTVTHTLRFNGHFSR